ncbi:MAG: chemotaxis protein CheW, partial [Desulfuromonadaceae bacterium]
MPKSENNQQILKKRALTLAEKPSDRTANKDLMEVVEFLLAEERYAIESSYISEVYPLRDLTTLPGTPPFVRGIINLRGKILSIIDLRIFFALPETGLSDLNKVIVLHNRNMEFGILADTVLGARSILRGSLLPALPTL